ncbi:MAG: MTH1187 family thiamine-binding protein [candidate division Zixibacteria bacterium]|nr:MTH1187 family thiamine-binding protein [candidate division Zixibacteria bacterium]
MSVTQFSIFPVGVRESLSKDVAKILDIIDKSGLSYQFTAMSTIVEGNWDEVMALIKKCRDAMRKSHSRIYTSIVIDDRKRARKRLSGKVEAVENILNRKLQK